MRIFEISKSWPPEERYSLTDQIRRPSRSVCANIAEAWRRRRYPAHLVSKLSDCEGEAAETTVHVEFALLCRYIDAETAADLYERYERIIGQLVRMSSQADQWSLPASGDGGG